jgi:hypothetical protein
MHSSHHSFQHLKAKVLLSDGSDDPLPTVLQALSWSTSGLHPQEEEKVCRGTVFTPVATKKATTEAVHFCDDIMGLFALKAFRDLARAVWM